jgi:Tfp pilus assembly protein PilX
MSKPSHARRGERGSAYIVVLLALVILTIVGLSLVMVTQTEVQLGSNERTISRTFFATDSGISVAVARHLLEGKDATFTYVQNESSLGSQRIADQVVLSAFTLVSLPTASEFSSVNANDIHFVNANHFVSVTAQRVGWDGTGMPPVTAKVFSQSTVSVDVRITNEQEPGIAR